jgi:hypothetical protein
MSCGHAQCTGKHDTSLPRAELCPVAAERHRARHRAYHREYSQTEKGREYHRAYQQRWSTTTAKGILCALRGRINVATGRLDTLMNELTPDTRLVLEKYLSRELGGAA